MALSISRILHLGFNCIPNCVMFFFRYKISLLKTSVRALMVSNRTSIRTDTRGFLSMQYMIKLDDGQVCFAEYFVSFDCSEFQ